MTRTEERLLRQILEQHEKTDGYNITPEMSEALRLAKEHIDTVVPRDTYKPTRWWRAVGVNGRLQIESSSEVEVRGHAKGSDVVSRLYSSERGEWRIAPDPDAETLAEVKEYREMLAEDEED